MAKGGLARSYMRHLGIWSPVFFQIRDGGDQRWEEGVPGAREGQVGGARGNFQESWLGTDEGKGCGVACIQQEVHQLPVLQERKVALLKNPPQKNLVKDAW